MVGPSTTDEDRATFVRRLRVGFALFVGASMALVAFHGDAEPVYLGVALVAGTAAGALLAWWVFPGTMGQVRQ